jgi:hypothetical protein
VALTGERWRPPTQAAPETVHPAADSFETHRTSAAAPTLDAETARGLAKLPDDTATEIIVDIKQRLCRGRLEAGDSHAQAMMAAAIWGRHARMARRAFVNTPSPLPMIGEVAGAIARTSAVRPRERRSSSRPARSRSPDDDDGPAAGLVELDAARLIREPAPPTLVFGCRRRPGEGCCGCGTLRLMRGDAT